MAERSIAFGLFAKDNASGVFKKVGVAAQKSAEAVDKATEKLAKATLSQADAAGKVRVAETKLKELRDSGKASATQLAKAEEDLSSAQRKQTQATKDLERATKDMESAQRSATTRSINFGDVASKAGAKLSSMGKAAAKAFVAVAAAAAVALARVGWVSIQAASDLNETIDKTRAIFGKATKAVVAFADTAADKIGQSKTQALDAASTFGIFGRAAGLQGKPLTDFSIKLTQLASDLASFYNTDPAEAITAIGAALRGESEPLRKYGVLLNDDTLKARALSIGLLKTSVDMTKVRTAQAALSKARESYVKIAKDGNKTDADRAVALAKVKAAEDKVKTALAGKLDKLTTQQKIQAAYAEILAQTVVQQGNFADTADGLANSQRTLLAQWADAKTKLGIQLLPTMLQFVTYIRKEVIPALQDWLEVNGPKLSEAFKLLSPKIVRAAEALGKFVSWAVDHKDALKSMVDVIVSLGIAFKVFTTVNAVVSGIMAVATALGWLAVAEGAASRGAAVPAILGGAAAVAAGLATYGFMSGAGGSTPKVGKFDKTTQQDKLGIQGAIDESGKKYLNVRGSRVYIDDLPGRATGGPVTSGTPYMVGERGPELFVPQASGTIIPNGRGVTENHYHVTIQGNVMTQDQTLRWLRDGLAQMNRRNGAGAAVYGV